MIKKVRSYFQDKEKIFDLLLLLLFTLFSILTLDYPGESQRFPFLFLFAAMLMLILKLLAPISSKLTKIVRVEGMFNLSSFTADLPQKKTESIKKNPNWTREIQSFAWVVIFLALVYLVGILYAIPLFLFAFLKMMGKRKAIETLVVTFGVTGFVYFLFVRILHIEFYKGIFFV